MIGTILLLLVILWVLGYLQFPLTNTTLFNFGARPVSLSDLLTFLIILWLISVLPNPFRGIALVLLLLWVLSLLGIIAIAGFSSLIMLAFIVGLVLYVMRWI